MTKPLSVIIPIYYEEGIIQELYQRLSVACSKVNEDHELIFVNDGSRDRSLEEIKKVAASDPRVRYISFTRNFGHQVAVCAGLDHCHGEAVVIIDGDLQDPPELIPELYARYREGYPVVLARREKRKGESIFKKTTAKAFYRILQRITHFDIPLDTGDFRLIDREVVEALKQMPERNKFLRGQIAWLGFKRTEVFFKRDPRREGKTKYTLKKMIRFAMDGITAFSDAPLKMVTQAGFVVSGLALLVILYALFSHFILGETITGWTSLIISSMFIGGIQLISIGVIGLYISRINTNVQDRPLYVVEEKKLNQID
ncbi:MAG: glycosyltransferase family 2 protein [Bacteroidota bacterium]|nr:glycosyltransferase family 2 protein [Bacteroidota bacterium]